MSNKALESSWWLVKASAVTSNRSIDMKDRTRASIIQRSGESEGKDGAATLKYSPGGCGKLKRQHRVRKERQGSGIVLRARDGDVVTSNRSIHMTKNGHAQVSSARLGTRRQRQSGNAQVIHRLLKAQAETPSKKRSDKALESSC